MRYVKNFFICFFIVFFVNYLLPGIDVVSQTKIPHLGGDFIFAFSLGFLNFLVVPLLSAFDGYLTKVRVAIVSLLLNFAAYALLKVLSIGVFIVNLEGYVSASAVVAVGCFIVHCLEMKHRSPSAPPPHDGLPPV